MIPHELEEKRERLIRQLQSMGSCMVAFSGGVDSTLLAKAAVVALGDKAMAVHGVSNSTATGEREMCIELARRIGIRLEIVETHEFSVPDYYRNEADRCYHCKRSRFEQIAAYAQELGFLHVAEGSNVDDRGDHRPGRRAVDELGISSPLMDAGLSKSEIREMARDWELPNWDKPSTPCLTTRIAYGLEPSIERLAKVDRAEKYLASCGISPLRVRLHADDLARVEVPPEQLGRLTAEPLRTEMLDVFQQLGFKYVTLDLHGYRSGSMNRVLNDDQLERE